MAVLATYPEWQIDGIDKPVDLNVYAESPKQWRSLKEQGIQDGK